MQASSKHSITLDKNYEAIQSVTAIVADTLGPDGLNVMLVDEFGSSFCTNDGVAILSNLQIKNPIAKYAKDAALAQEERVGDGTTSVCVMLEAILKKCIEKLKTEDIGAIKLSKEIQIAKEIIKTIIKKNSKKIEDIEDSHLFFASRIASRNDEELSKVVSELYRKSFKNYVGEFFDLSNHIYGYKNQEERVVEGLLLKKKAHLNSKTRINNGSLLMIKGSFEPQPISSEAANTDEGVRKFSNNVQEILEVCKKIKKKNIEAVFCSGSIFQQAEELLVKEGVFVISHLSESQFNNIQKLSKAKVVTRSELFEQDQNFFLEKIGEFKSITWDEGLKAFLISGPRFNFNSLILSQNTKTLLEERVRVAEDSAKVFYATFKEGYSEGGGVTEIIALKEFRESYPNSPILDILEAALTSIFRQIKINSDYREEFLELRQKYKEAQVVDSTRVKTSIVDISFDLCSQIIKVKSVVLANNCSD
jgi:chaperonin GroEL (HSP60 family)